MSKPRQVDIPIRAAKPADPNVVSRICGLADSGEIERAGDEVAALFSRGMYGVSPFWIWLAARFAQGGPAELPRLLGMAAKQLATDETLRPEALPEWGRALGWFVDNARSRVRFHGKFHDQTWTRWRSTLTAGLEPELEAASEELVHTSAAAIAGELGSGAYELCALVRRSFGGLIPAPEPNVEDALGPVVESSEEEDSSQDSEPSGAEWGEHADEFESADASDSAEESPPVGGWLARDGINPTSLRSNSVQPQRSSALRALQAKLCAFERLAGEQSWPLAAMVARDIERELSQFDPVRYFPDYFSSYLNTLCEVGSELEMHMQPADSLEAQATERLYHADPERFLAQLDASSYRAS